MRTLLLFRGAPGCGKSTYIKEHNLEQYVLSADTLRLMCQSAQETPAGQMEISPQNDDVVWEMLFKLLEVRMSHGEFTVIDATNSKTVEMNRYKNLAKQYRYRMYVIDMHYDGGVYVSFSGGKDSTVLAHLTKQLFPDVPLVFSNTGLEYSSIQKFARDADAVFVYPKMGFSDVVSTYVQVCGRGLFEMRTLEQVDRDIEIVRYDMHELMRMRQPISIVGEELVDLYEERNKILKSMGDTK